MTRETHQPRSAFKVATSNQHHHHHNQNHNQHHHHNHHHQQHNKVIHVEPFQLFSKDDKSLKQACEFIESTSLNRFKMCVVTVISKTALDDPIKDNLVQTLVNNSTKANFRAAKKFRNKLKGGKMSKRDDGSQDLSKEESDIKREEEEQREQEQEEQKEVEQQLDDCNYENQVVGQVDCKAGIIVLNLTSFTDANKLHLLCQDLVNKSNNIGSDQEQQTRQQTVNSPIDPLKQSLLASSWPQWNQNLLKTLLTLLIMSHIVIFYNPEPSIDYNLIQLFKILENLRLKSQSRISDLLETIASKQMFPQQWIRQARLACPRALFVCSTINMQVNLNQMEIASLKRDIEDQIYRLLKKTNIIGRANGQLQPQQALFCLPERDDFVFLVTKKDLNFMGLDKLKPTSSPQPTAVTATSDITKSAETIDYKEFCSMLFKSLDLDFHNEMMTNGGQEVDDDTGEVFSTAQLPSSEVANEEDDSHQRHSSLEETPLDLTATQPTVLNGTQATTTAINKKSSPANSNPNNQVSAKNRFKRFLMKHVGDVQAAAQVEQQEGNGSNNRNRLVAILPRCDDFFQVLLRLKNLMFPKLDNITEESTTITISTTTTMNCWSMPDERRFVDIYDMNNQDELFSLLHCSKTRSAAFEFYTRNIYRPFSQANHESALDSARDLYLNHARGKARGSNLYLLVEQCKSYWDSMKQTTKMDTNNLTKGTGRSSGSSGLNSSGRFCRQLLSKSVSAGDSTVPTSNSLQSPSKPNLVIVRRSNGIKMSTCCDCGRQTNYMISPVDRKKKLERVDIHKVND